MHVTEPEAAKSRLNFDREQTLGQISDLEREFSAIVASAADGSAGGDDEHDPEGATLAFERQHVAADVVFLDPPYRMKDAYANTLRALADSSLIWAMSVVIAEHEKKFDPGDEFGALRRFRLLAQGSAALSFYRMGSASDVRV